MASEPGVSLGVTAAGKTSARSPWIRRAGAVTLAVLACSVTALVSARAAGQGAGMAHPADHAAAAPAPPPSPLSVRWEWWNDAEVKHELVLTDDKVKRIDDIYQARAKDSKVLADEADRERMTLDRMTNERVADEAAYRLQVLKFESLWSRLTESRLTMLYHIYKELTPEQYKKLQEISKRRADQSGRGGSFGPPPGPGR